MNRFHNIFEKVIQKINVLVRNIRIHHRLISLFLFLSLLPMLVTGIYSYQKSRDAIHDKINTYSIQVVDQIARNIKVELDRLKYDTIEIGFSTVVQKTLMNYDDMTEWEILKATSQMRDILVKKFSFLHDVSDVLLFTTDDQKIIAYGDKGFKLNFKDSYRDKLLTEIRTNNGNPVWRAIGKREEKHLVKRVKNVRDPQGIIVGRVIKSLYEGRNIGSLIIRTNERFFSNIYREIDIGRGTDIFVLNSEGEVVSTRTDQIPFNRYYKESDLINKINKNVKQGQTTFNMKIDGERYLVAYSPLKSAGWYVVSTIPHSYLNLESGQIARKIAVLGIICFMLAVLLSFIFTKSISNPLNKLITAMDSVKEGDLSVNIHDRNKDEIAEVTRDFNIMVKEIKELLNDVKNKEKEKRKAEFRALQAQINPHFLSNILNTARVMANMQKAENLESLLNSLIDLLHLSMGGNDSFITVREEIKYLKNYINIQQFRYYNKFEVDFEVEEELLNKKLPKFLLQPILENSIIHGIAPKKGAGIIEVKGYIYEEKMIFTITDNGVGMSANNISKLLQGKDHRSGHFSGIGINNVQQRTKNYFGPEFGISIESYKNQFTKVEIILPLKNKEEDDA